MNSLIDSGEGLVLFMAHFSPSIQQRKQVYNCKADDVDVVYNERTNRLCFIYKRLLANHLHSKETEQCLADS